MVKSLHTRESGLSGGQIATARKMISCFWPRPNVVSRAARIIDLCLSPAHATEYADGARYSEGRQFGCETDSIAVSARAAREEIFAFRYVALQIFGPPLRPVSRFSPSVTKICFVRSLYMCMYM